jgi:hypothetical protein
MQPGMRNTGLTERMAALAVTKRRKEGNR